MEKKEPSPGDGLRSLRWSSLFKAVNFELFVKPEMNVIRFINALATTCIGAWRHRNRDNMILMTVGSVAIIGSLGYIAYMKKKYEGMGYYAAISEDGTQQYRMKRSKSKARIAKIENMDFQRNGLLRKVILKYRGSNWQQTRFHKYQKEK